MHATRLQFELLAMQPAGPSWAGIIIAGVTLGLVCLAIGVTHLVLRRSSFPISLAQFLGVAAALAVGYVVTLFFLTGQFKYQLADEELVPVEPLVVPNETPLIELTPSEKSKSRPTWVEATPKLAGDTYEISVASDPKLTAAEAQADLAEKMQAATRKYITDLLYEGISSVQVNREFIVRRIQRETYLEPVTLTVGEMVIAHGLLAFDNSVRDEFRQQHRAAEVRMRMQQAGGIAGLVLVLLATVFGFLKLDTLTRGYYSGRLQLAAAALILGVVAFGLMLA